MQNQFSVLSLFSFSFSSILKCPYPISLEQYLKKISSVFAFLSLKLDGREGMYHVNLPSLFSSKVTYVDFSEPCVLVTRKINSHACIVNAHAVGLN